MGDENIKTEEEVKDVISEFDDSNITDLLNEISSNQDKLIDHFNPEYTEEEIESERVYNEKVEKVLDIIIEKEERRLEEGDTPSSILDEIVEIKEYIVENELEQEARIEQAELEQEARNEQDALISTIQEDLALANSYLYTVNVYLAGFFVIVLCYILTKLLIGFFKPFL